MSGGPTVSVIVPVHNGGDAFRRSLAALAELRPQPLEIIVVGDGDTDGSCRLAESYGARVLAIPGPGGPARARNRGARAAQGDILFFVDADVAVPPDAVARVRSVFQVEDPPAAVFGTYDEEPAEGNFLSQYKNLLHHYVHQTSREEASTFWAACGAIRRETFLAAGGFDERYRLPSIEDIELGYRLKKAGHRIRLLKTLQVKHLKRWGAASLLRSDFLCRALPWTRLILREARLIDDLNLRLSSRLSVLLAYGALAAAVVGFWRSGWLALAAALALALAVLNAPLYGFFRRRRGAFFALATIPWHWLYYLYGGLAFALGLAAHLLARRGLVSRPGSEERPALPQ